MWTRTISGALGPLARSGVVRPGPTRRRGRSPRAPTVPCRALLRGGALLARDAPQARLLALGQAPEVAADLLGVDLATGQVHVGLVDEMTLVAGQGHPLGQRVVGVGQARRPVGPRLVGEGHAVLGEQVARLRQVGDDRLVRVDEVRVRRAGAGGLRAALLRSGGQRTPDADEPELAVHVPLLVVDAGAQELAGALLGAALAARVVDVDGHAGTARLVALVALGDPRGRDLPQQGHDD